MLDMPNIIKKLNKLWREVEGIEERMGKPMTWKSEAYVYVITSKDIKAWYNQAVTGRGGSSEEWKYRMQVSNKVWKECLQYKELS